MLSGDDFALIGRASREAAAATDGERRVLLEILASAAEALSEGRTTAPKSGSDPAAPAETPAPDCPYCGEPASPTRQGWLCCRKGHQFDGQRGERR